MTTMADYPAQILSLVKVEHGPDDDGNLVVNYELRRGDGTLLVAIQSTDHDAVFFPKADKWTVGWVDHREQGGLSQPTRTEDDLGHCSWCEEAESPPYLAHEGHDPECPFVTHPTRERTT